MKRLAISIAAALAVTAPLALAQGNSGSSSAPAADKASPSAIEFAIAGFHVNILENGEGGAVSVAGEDGQSALLAFLTPAAGEAALGAIEDETISVVPAPLGLIMQKWDGPIVFESSSAEIEHAKALTDEQVNFLAPAFFVTTDGKETRIKTPEGLLVPILLSYDDAESMVTRLAETGADESTIEIVPIEFASVLKQISSPEAPIGYRIYTHPGTIESIDAATSAEQN
ncbi:MAG: hypothetical protein RLN72_14045 [Henriciella sp.]